MKGKTASGISAKVSLYMLIRKKPACDEILAASFCWTFRWLLNNNHVQQELPWLLLELIFMWLTPKKIIFVCTVFLFIYTVNDLWNAASYTCPANSMNCNPQNLPFRLSNSVIDECLFRINSIIKYAFIWRRILIVH